MTKILKMAEGLALAAGLAMACPRVPGQVATNFYTFNAGQTLPQNSLTGITLSTDVTIAPNFAIISNLLVTVNISGGRNSYLYAYVTDPAGATAILLNRAGVTAQNRTGYTNAGVNVTFSDNATNGSIHFYQNVPGYQNDLNRSGQITGVWQPDGENISPRSPARSFTGAQTAMLSSFRGTTANGKWTLFVAETGRGGATVVNNWGLEIISVPEPSALGLNCVGGLALLILLRKRRG